MNAKLQLQNFEMVAGDTKPIGILVVDQDEQAVPLTGGTAQLAFARRPGGVALFTKEGVFPASPINRVNFVVDPGDTAMLFGSYYWESQFIDATGRRSTVARGFVSVLRQSIIN